MNLENFPKLRPNNERAILLLSPNGEKGKMILPLHDA
jgi:hypothetical protein